MTSKELTDLVMYANSLGSTNEDRKRVITQMLVNAKGDELKDLDLNTLTWLLDGLDKAEKEGSRALLKRDHLVYRNHDTHRRNRAEIKPQVTLRKRHSRGINAASETTSSEADVDTDDLPENWVSSTGEVIHSDN